jgi:hypothetical protein
MDPITHTIFPYTRMTVRITSTLYLYRFEPNLILDEYFDDLGVAYRAELKELYELGCRKPYVSFLLLLLGIQC